MKDLSLKFKEFMRDEQNGPIQLGVPGYFKLPKFIFFNMATFKAILRSFHYIGYNDSTHTIYIRDS